MAETPPPVVDDRAIYLVIRRAILSVLHIFDKKYRVTTLDK
jgi:hypothetical protein